MKQLKLFSVKNEFGGSLLIGKRHEARPLSQKLPTHLVLKATNSFRLLQNTRVIHRLLNKYADRLGVKIYDLAVNADHIHLVLLADRPSYVRWIRAVTSLLVQTIPQLKWKLRPFTRIVTWGRDFAHVRGYLGKNREEGQFIVKMEERVKDFRSASRRRFLASA